MNFKRLTLEISLKPFRHLSDDAISRTCERVFLQWQPLVDRAETVSVLLWCADGSEILDYRGRLEDEFEWAKYIGVANPSGVETAAADADALSIHAKPRLYSQNAPVFTYAGLQQIVAALKETGARICGKYVRVGATFDPGPEFAKSSFKYQRHPEICTAGTMGRNTFVCCYAELNADSAAYAGFPDGIPVGTSLGTFLGRQTHAFTHDLGFDYIWFSNGFGFGLEAWGICGVVFDGTAFCAENTLEVKSRIRKFWSDFRTECPELPIETRGTNLATGMDLASDAVPLRDIYREVPGLTAPPNSPWAALNGNFGLELSGWMSHIAELPAKQKYPFRFYTHDPWFLNSPWLDRYGRHAHDIYLPLSIARLDADAQVQLPDSLAFLSVDDSYGRMPEQVPLEVIPKILQIRATAPDEPGPLIWLYPFDEYHDMTFSGNGIDEVFFGDWFMATAINTGFTLNSVISTGNFLKALRNGADFSGNILVTPTASVRNDAVLRALKEFLTNQGQVLFYGPVKEVELQDLLGLEKSMGLSGEFVTPANDQPRKLKHDALLSGGSLDMTAGPCATVLAVCEQDGETRALATCRAAPEWHGGKAGWVRGSNSFTVAPHGLAPQPLDRNEFFYPETLMREILKEYGYTFTFAKISPEQPEPVLILRRHRNAVYLAAYVPDLTVAQSFHFPEGAPVFTETETLLQNGHSLYHLPKASNLECRVFVEQQSGVVKCKIRHSGHPGIDRRLEISGLKDATLRFRPEPGTSVQLLAQPQYPYTRGNFLNYRPNTAFRGTVLEVHNISEKVMISWSAHENGRKQAG